MSKPTCIGTAEDRVQAALMTTAKRQGHLRSSYSRFSDAVGTTAWSGLARLWHEEGKPVLSAIAEENADLPLDVQLAAL